MAAQGFWARAAGCWAGEASYFEGDMTPPALAAEALGEARIRELAAKLPDPDAPAGIEPWPRLGKDEVAARLADRIAKALA